jgi:hypothetical protein
MYNFFRSLLNFLQGITASWLSVFCVFSFSALVSYFAYRFNLELPKPETIIEVGKFYLSDPGPYIKGLLFNLIAAFSWVFLGSAMIYDVIQSREDYPNWFNILFSFLGLIFIGVSLYFLGYFILLLVTILLIGIIAYFFIQGDNKRTKY